MKRCLRSLFLGFLMLSTALCVAHAQTNAPADTTVKLHPIKHLRKGLDLWPLIAGPSTPEQERINATFTSLNQRLREAIKECDSDSTGELEEWSRKITITMTGPRFLSMVAREEIYCGGAHPDGDTLALVFDLGTGNLVDWMTLIAGSARAKPHSDRTLDGTAVGTLIDAALLKISKERAVSECKDSFVGGQSYQLWPDARSGRLIAKPIWYRTVDAFCAEEIALTLDEARKLGFDESILTAIEQAHRASPSAAR